MNSAIESHTPISCKQFLGHKFGFEKTKCTFLCCARLNCEWLKPILFLFFLLAVNALKIELYIYMIFDKMMQFFTPFFPCSAEENVFWQSKRFTNGLELLGVFFSLIRILWNVGRIIQMTKAYIYLPISCRLGESTINQLSNNWHQLACYSTG